MNTLSQAEKNKVIVKVIQSAIQKKWNIYQLSKMIGRSIADTSKLVSQICREYPATYGKAIQKLNWPRDITVGHIYIDSYSTPVISNPALYKIDDQIRLLIRNQLNNPDSNWLDKAKELLNKKKNTDLYTGGSLVHGERLGEIVPGSHVIAKPLRGKPFHEIFLAESTKQRLFVFSDPERDIKINVLKKEIETKEKTPGYILSTLDKKKIEYIERIANSQKCWFSKQDIIDGKMAEYAKLHKYTVVKPAKQVRTIYSAGKPMGTVHDRFLVSVNSTVT